MITPAEVTQIIGKKVLIHDDAIIIDTKLSQGSWLVDANTKKQYIDCFSQYGSQPLGWNHPKLIHQKKRLANAALHKFSNPDVYSEEYAAFVQNLSYFVPDFDHLFFIDGGALAVENALKVAFDWKAQVEGLKDSECHQLDVIHFQEAFHGRSGYTLSLTNNLYDDTKIRLFPKFNWSRIINPKLTFPIRDIESLEIRAIHQLTATFETRLPAAVIIEPIQGEGGDNHFRKEFFVKLRELCDHYSALLIFDEVQTGFGTTGKTWAYQWFDVVPDILVFGKKTQVCGIAVRNERLKQVEHNTMNTQSRLSSTWGGNILDMTRSSIIMEIMKEDDLIENANKVGQYFLDKLNHLGLENTRGRGLMIAFDLKDTQERNEVLCRIKEKVLALPCGQKSIRFRPHLTLQQDEVTTIIDHIKSVI